ncbi:DnaJ domain-containing protein [Adlercreutzia sp. ZJ304]|uniref:J domain-containing protein n=1 Tax=Adlercreutzia sp. ZJ304 TaxID=2709791 RepID=UPI0013EC1804|nr:DnaJ domain-containing protein [Adlercreutzia sp. ZJ304]
MDNPYDILGVSRDASMDEVKKAYRKKARENHPDLNPGDAQAEERMNKINEAYDRITNPEKYAASDARRRGYAGPSGPRGYGGTTYGPGGAGGAGAGSAGGAGGSSGSGGGYYDPFGYGGEQGGSSGQDPYGWTTINFDDLFGGAYATQSAPIHPEEAAGDSPEVRQAIYAINSQNYRNAINILQQIPSGGRNARWYYLFALANNGAGNTVAAHDNIRRARQMDPNNNDYARAESQFTRRAQTYTQQGEGRGFTSFGIDPNWLCCCICLGPTCCSYFSRMCAYGGFGFF